MEDNSVPTETTGDPHPNPKALVFLPRGHGLGSQTKWKWWGQNVPAKDIVGPSEKSVGKVTKSALTKSRSVGEPAEGSLLRIGALAPNLPPNAYLTIVALAGPRVETAAGLFWGLTSVRQSPTPNPSEFGDV
jgi:hypothetical protein